MKVEKLNECNASGFRRGRREFKVERGFDRVFSFGFLYLNSTHFLK